MEKIMVELMTKQVLVEINKIIIIQDVHKIG